MPLAIPVSEGSYFSDLCGSPLAVGARPQTIFASTSRRLEGHEIGDGIVARAVGRAFKAFYRPPADDTGLRAPKLLRKVGDGRAL